MKKSTARIRFIGRVTKFDEEKELETIRISGAFRRGLKSIGAYSHLIVLYWIHMRDNRRHRSTVEVIPKRHPGAPRVGVFASRSPSRPNPIGLCVTRLISARRGVLTVKGLDALVGSPVIDIKPYLPRADRVMRARTPAWAKRGPAA